MKKFIKRLFGIVLGAILCCDNLCYADMISITPMDNLEFGGTLLIPIGILVFFAFIISYVVLKITARKERSLGQINEETQKEIDNNKKYLSICIFVLTLLISTVICMKNREYYSWMWIIPIIVLLITAIIFRAKARIKTAYALYAITVAIFAIICSYGNNVKNKEIKKREEIRKSGFYNISELEAFNSRFIAYEGHNKKISEVRALYSEVIANNASNIHSGMSERNISISGIITLDKENSSIDRLEHLDNHKSYNIKIFYNKYGRIESIYVEEENRIK